MKRNVALILSAFLIAGAFTACGDTENIKNMESNMSEESSSKETNETVGEDGIAYCDACGYAANYDSDRECTIIGILIRTETFIREYMSALAADTAMLNFFLEPQKNKFSAGEPIEAIRPGGENIPLTVDYFESEEGERRESCPHPEEKLYIPDLFDSKLLFEEELLS